MLLINMLGLIVLSVAIKMGWDIVKDATRLMKEIDEEVKKEMQV